MTKKETFIVRSARTGVFTLPSGRRVHTLDRGTFERAIGAANNYISNRGSERSEQQQQSGPSNDRPAKQR